MPADAGNQVEVCFDVQHLPAFCLQPRNLVNHCLSQLMEEGSVVCAKVQASQIIFALETGELHEGGHGGALQPRQQQQHWLIGIVCRKTAGLMKPRQCVDPPKESSNDLSHRGERTFMHAQPWVPDAPAILF